MTRLEINPHDVVRWELVSAYRAIQDSIEVVHERHSGKDAAFAVAFEDRDGHQRRGLVGLCRHHGEGWRPSGAFMGSAREVGPNEVFETYGGWGPGDGKERAVFGGWVADPAAVSTRLVDVPNGRVAEEPVERGVVIFVDKRGFGLRHARVELVASAGVVLRAGPAMHKGG